MEQMMERLVAATERMEDNKEKMDAKIDANQEKIKARIDANNENSEVLPGTLVSRMDIY
jgi:hypothetical protein